MMGTIELDEDHPLWLVNEQIKGLLEGLGASEDHEDVLKFLRATGLPEDTVSRLHRAIVHGDRKVLPGQSALPENPDWFLDFVRDWGQFNYIGTLWKTRFYAAMREALREVNK